MNGALAGQLGTVTGAGSGIGRQIAITAADAGAYVHCLDIDAEGLAATVEHAGLTAGRLIPIQCDVSEEAAVRDALNPNDPFDFLVNAAGIEGPAGGLTALDAVGWDRVMAVNVRSAFLMMKQVLPSMAARSHGSIVNVASVAGLRGSRNLPAYASSKHALLGLTRSVVAEFAEHGVRANTLCPGPIDTPLQDRAERDAADPARFRRDQELAIPQGRYGTTSDVADAALFLLTDAAAYINGATLTVDGGMTATL